jgi:hypothetical protein
MSCIRRRRLHRSTSRRSVSPAVAVRPVTPSLADYPSSAATDLLHLRRAFGCLSSSFGSLSTSRHLAARLLVSRSHWLSLCVWSLHLATRLLVIQIAPTLLHLCRASGRAVSPLDFSSVGCTGSRRASDHCVSRRAYSSPGCTSSTSTLSRGSSRRSSSTTPRRAGSSSTTPPPAGSSSTTSPPPRVRVPRHVAARHAARCAARRRLLRVAQARRQQLCLMQARRRLLRLAQARRQQLYLMQARRRLLRLRRASGCLGTLRGSSRGSSHRPSSTTSPPPRVRLPRHVARPVTWLIVDYSVRRDFVLRPHWLYFSHVVRRDHLSRGNTGSTSSTPRAATTSSSGHIASTIHLDYFSKLVENGSHAPNI